MVEKVFTPASITLTGRQLLPSLSRKSVPAGGPLGVTLPGPCSRAEQATVRGLYSPDGHFIADLGREKATIPSTVTPGRYFVNAECDTMAESNRENAGYAYGFTALTVTR